jgi:hypothetical protein
MSEYQKLVKMWQAKCKQMSPIDNARHMYDCPNGMQEEHWIEHDD